MASQGDELVARKLENARRKQSTPTTAKNAGGYFEERETKTVEPLKSTGGNTLSAQVQPRPLTYKKASRGNDPSSSLYSSGDWYSRPDLDAMAESVANQALQREKDEEDHKRTLIQVNRERCLSSYSQQKAKRILLQARCGLPTNEAILKAHNISEDEVRKTERPLTDHNSSHIQYLDANKLKVNQQLTHRQQRLAKYREKQMQRAAMEEALGTTYAKKKRQQADMASGTMRSSRTAPNPRMTLSFNSTSNSCPPLPMTGTGVVSLMLHDDNTDMLDTNTRALKELDDFQTRQEGCYKLRYSGVRKKENFSLSTDHKAISKHSFEQPLYNAASTHS